MSTLLAKKHEENGKDIEQADIDSLRLHNKDVLNDVKDVMKELRLFRSSKLDVVRNDLNCQKKESKLVNKLSKLIDLVKSKVPNEALVLVVCQLIEDYIWMADKEKMNEIKKKIAILVLQPVLETNEEAIGIIITLICRKLKKSTVWRRHKHMIIRIVSNFFFSRSLTHRFLIYK